MADVTPCRLYLQLPPSSSAQAEAALDYALAALHPACVLIASGEAEPLDLAWAKTCLDRTRQRDVPLLVQDIEAAQALGADGIHLPAEALTGSVDATYKAVRAQLGDASIVGVDCRSRHDAMVLAELGADYVAFPVAMQSTTGTDDFSGDLIAWWSEIFQTPCVAWDIESREQAAAAIGAGADFIAVKKTRAVASDAPQFLAELAALTEGSG